MDEEKKKEKQYNLMLTMIYVFLLQVYNDDLFKFCLFLLYFFFRFI